MGQPCSLPALLTLPLGMFLTECDEIVKQVDEKFLACLCSNVLCNKKCYFDVEAELVNFFLQ